MMMTHPNNDLLDDIFATARRQIAKPSDELIALVLTDAAKVQSLGITASQPRIWTRIMDIVGGWPAVGGLVTATVAGVWIGISPPTVVQNVTTGIWGDQISLDLLSTAILFETEIWTDG